MLGPLTPSEFEWSMRGYMAQHDAVLIPVRAKAKAPSVSIASLRYAMDKVNAHTNHGKIHVVADALAFSRFPVTRRTELPR